MRRTAITALVLVLVATSLSADQQWYVDRSDAERAAQLTTAGGRARLFCAPCGDEEWQEVRVATAVALHKGHVNYWELQINGTGADLAYTYIERDGRWENLAMILSLEVSAVPRFIGGPALDPTASQLPLGRHVQDSEEELDGVVQQLSAKLDEEGRQLLEEAQLMWQDHCRATAKLEAHLAGQGSAANAAYDEAVLRLTRERIRELTRW